MHVLSIPRLQSIIHANPINMGDGCISSARQHHFCVRCTSGGRREKGESESVSERERERERERSGIARVRVTTRYRDLNCLLQLDVLIKI